MMSSNKKTSSLVFWCDTPYTSGKECPIAHVRCKNDSEWFTHELEAHLRSVGKIAEQLASGFGAQAWAAAAGQWHDLGKYNAEFQAYIRSASGFEREQAHVEAKGRVDHSTAGAIHAVDQWGLPGRVLAYLIAGHHAGLPDWEKLASGTGGSLRERLTQRELLDQTLVADIPAELLEAEQPAFHPPGGKAGFALWVRMLFSCLVDADFLDTEAFMDGERAALRGQQPDLASLLVPFDTHMKQLAQRAADTLVNRLRTGILQNCRNKASHRPGLFSLTVPTGGGKTLSGMAFALEHAVAHGKRRVIHVIPYTSIIEQTAKVFHDIFGEAVIEHHSSLDPERETARSRLAAENWDAPIIVTTSVQFFESLFAARTSRCRKLHNIVDSVVILDEAQLMPPELLQPILDVLNLLVQHYGVTVVLSTATQPALESRKDSFGRTLLRGLDQVEEIIPDPDALYAALERVRVRLPQDLNRPRDWDDLAAEIGAHETVLAIVNTRKQARELHRRMPKGTIHLSALMCGKHRSAVIAEIKEKLANEIPVRVVSTQLVEAGVDLDFPVVYRALAGLDSIAQAAGRCNREGKLEQGEVFVFVPPDAPPPGLMRRAASKAISVLASNGDDPLARENFRQFFRLFYDDCDLDKHNIERLLMPGSKLECQFRSAAKRFRLIEQTGKTILVRYHASEHDSEIAILLDTLRKYGPSRWLMRKLQGYSVTVSPWHFDYLRKNGQIEELYQGHWVQSEASVMYDDELGVVLELDALKAEDLVIS